VSAQNFPSVEELADFLAVINNGGASFKATAGLHNAVRHTAPDTGFTHHGFLNLLLATGRLLAGADVSDVRAALELTDGKALADEARNLTEHEALSVRGVFASYGSCSLTDPVKDLQELGLL
jgi:hypothetical protein